jgi:CRP/FNR family transcriptional regulator, cyclic AMP receptor protein
MIDRGGVESQVVDAEAAQLLSPQERLAINSGSWFRSLSAALRHDMLRQAIVRRYAHGTLIAARGEPADSWMACAKGAVQVTSTTQSGKQKILTYVQPGVWFGDVGILDGGSRTHDTYAQGETSLLCVSRATFLELLADHDQLANALLRLQARRLRTVFSLLEDNASLSVQALMAKQLLHLARTYGVEHEDGQGTLIDLRLRQEQVANLVGCSRQRANLALKDMERMGYLDIGTKGIVVKDVDALRNLVRQSDDWS